MNTVGSGGSTLDLCQALLHEHYMTGQGLKAPHGFCGLADDTSRILESAGSITCRRQFWLVSDGALFTLARYHAQGAGSKSPKVGCIASCCRQSMLLRKATFWGGFCSIAKDAICMCAMQVPIYEAHEIRRQRSERESHRIGSCASRNCKLTT